MSVKPVRRNNAYKARFNSLNPDGSLKMLEQMTHALDLANIRDNAQRIVNFTLKLDGSELSAEEWNDAMVRVQMDCKTLCKTIRNLTWKDSSSTARGRKTQ